MNRLKHILAVPMGLTAAGLLWLLWRQTGEGGLALGLVLALVAAVLLVMIGRRQRRGSGTSAAAILLGCLVLAGVAVAVPPMLDTPTRDAMAGDHPVFSAANLDTLRAQGKPVFLYFTADWCLTCKVNEAGALADTDVAAAFDKAGVQWMVGDWTNADPAITRFLEANGRSGVPLYLYYAPGARAPQVLPQVLTPGMLTALVAG